MVVKRGGKQAQSRSVSNATIDYGLRTSLAKEVKGQMSIVTVYQTVRPNLGPSSVVDQSHMAW